MSVVSLCLKRRPTPVQLLTITSRHFTMPPIRTLRRRTLRRPSCDLCGTAENGVRRYILVCTGCKVAVHVGASFLVPPQSFFLTDISDCLPAGTMCHRESRLRRQATLRGTFFGSLQDWHCGRHPRLANPAAAFHQGHPPFMSHTVDPDSLTPIHDHFFMKAKPG